MYNHINLKELRPKLPKVIKQVDQELDRYIISKHGKPVAILLALDDFESLIETLNETDDLENLKNIRCGLKEAKLGKTVAWKTVKKKYDL